MLLNCFLDLYWRSFWLFLSTNGKVSIIYASDGSVSLRRLKCDTFIPSNFTQEFNFKHAQIFSFFVLNLNQIRCENIWLLHADIFWTTINPSFKLFYFTKSMVCIIFNCKRQIIRTFVVLNSKLNKNKFWNFFELLNRLYHFYWGNSS